MSRNESRRKMSFIPIVRHGQEEEDEDLLNKEMDDLYQSTSPMRKLSTTVPEVIVESEEEDEEEDERHLNAKLLESVLEGNESDGASSTRRFDQPKTSKAFRNLISETLGETSEDDGNGSETNKNIPRNESNVTVNVGDELSHWPPDLFIQLNELVHPSDDSLEWRETARWIKYEENVEEGADRWGQPHVPSLSFHSLLNVRRCLETGIVLLDPEETDFSSLVFRVVELMYSEGVIRFDDRENVFRTIMLDQRYDRSILNFESKKADRRSHSLISHSASTDYLQGHRRSVGSLRKFSRRGSSAVFHPLRTSNMSIHTINDEEEESSPKRSTKVDVESSDQNVEDQILQNDYLLKCLPTDCEGVAVMTGVASHLDQPTVAFVRLSEAIKIPNILEVAVPVRFLFVLLGPETQNLNYHEVGRSISTLLSNRHFASIAFKAQSRKDLISAINNFLDDSLVLPPGKLDKEDLLRFEELKEKSDMIRNRKRQALREEMKSQGHLVNKEQLKFLVDKYEASQKKPIAPLQKTGRLWGGLINDWKRRLPLFKSDILDGLNSETLAATVFMYFACFATAITFGGLAGDLTKGQIGISETLLAASFVGMIFHLLCGQPLVIVGTTGPLILFDKALVDFCDELGFNFLTVRAYVGIWLIVIGLTVSAFEGSTYVRLFTRFTQEIFSALITLIYLYSTFEKTISVYRKNPLLTVSQYSSLSNESPEFDSLKVVNQPNSALFCTLLTLGTFILAYTLKIFRNSKFLGRSSRRALGDFGVPISITIFVAIANILSQVKTEKLNVPDGISPTKEREWLVPLWREGNPVWLPVVCVIPSLLVYILAFMETHISELILDKPERKLKKGSGFHWDIVLLCFLNSINGLFGMPWHCAAAVRSVAHISSVTVMSTNHPPGESPHIVEVKEQKVSGFCVSLLIGLSIFAAPILKTIPISVLFGVFLYMGICSMNGVQLFERIILFFVPVKYHPHVPYATRVLTKRMHFYTATQVIALVVLWTVNESPISLAFPFFLIMMVPLRKVLEYFYSAAELEALDGTQQKDNSEDDDFYEQTHIPA